MGDARFWNYALFCLWSEFKRPQSTGHFNDGLIIYIQVTLTVWCKNATVIIFCNEFKQSFVVWAWNRQGRQGRQKHNGLGRDSRSRTDSEEFPISVWSELTLLFFLSDSSLLVWVQRKKVNSFTDTLDACFSCLLSVHSSSQWSITSLRTEPAELPDGQVFSVVSTMHFHTLEMHHLFHSPSRPPLSSISR